MRIKKSLLMSAAAIALFATKANAAIFTLDSNDGTTWDTTNTFWNGATSTWVNDGTNTANFIGTGNTINLTQNISAQGVAISATGYTIAPGANTLTVGSVGVSASESATVNSFAINASQVIDASAGKTLSVGSITDAAGGTLTKTGSGTLSLTGSSTFAGLFTINAGTVQYAGNNALGSNAVTISGGTLDIQAFSDTVGAVTLSSGSIIGAGTLTGTSYSLQSGTVSANLGTGAVSVNTGSTTLSGTSASTSVTINSNGTLVLGAANRLDNSATVNVASTGTLNTNGFNDTIGTLNLSGGTIAGAGTLTAATYNSTGGTINANLGAGDFNITSGTTTLNGTSGSNNVTISGGTLTLGGSDKLSNAATVTVSGGSLNLAANNDTVGTFTMSSGSLDGSGTLTASTYSLSGGTVNAKLGAGTVDVAGTVALGSAGRLNSTSTLNVNSGSLTLAGAESVAAFNLIGGTLAGSGNTLTSNSIDLQSGAVSANLAGTGGLTKTTGATVALSGDNSGLSGTVDVSAGTLVAQSQNALGTGLVDLNGTGNLTLQNNSSTNFGNDVQVNSNARTITVDRASAGAGITHTLGALEVTGSGWTLNVVKGTNVTSGTAELVVGDVTLSGTGFTTFNVGTGAKLTTGSFHGTGGIIKTGTDTLDVTLASDFTGNVDVQAGTMNATLDTSFLGDINNETTLNFINNISPVATIYVNSLTGAGATDFDVGNAEIHSIIGVDNATGANSLSVNNGKLTADLEAGTISALRLVSSTISKGTGKTLNVTVTGTTDVDTLIDGTMTLSGTRAEFQSIQGGAVTSTAAINSVADLSGGTHSFTGINSVTSLSGGQTTFAGSSTTITSLSGGPATITTFNGNATIDSVTGTGTLSISSGKSLSIKQGTFSGTISGNGSLVLAGDSSQTLTLSGTNVDNYTGTTTVSNGGIVEYTSNVTLAGQFINNSGYVTFDLLANLNGGLAGTAGQTYFTGVATLASRSGSGEAYFYDDATISSVTGTSGIIDINVSGKNLTLGSGSYSGTLQGDGNIVKNGTGTLTLSGTNVDNYTGSTTVNSGGTLTFSDIVTLAGQVDNAGILNFDKGATISSSLIGAGTTNFLGDSSIAAANGSGTITIAAGKVLTISSGAFTGTISGAGSVTKNTTGTLSINGANLGGFTGTITNNGGGILDFTGVTTLEGALVNNAFATFAGVSTLNGGLSGTGQTWFSADGNVVSSRSGTGTVNVDGDTTFSNIAGSGTLAVNTSKTLTLGQGSFSGTISGAGSLTKNGTGSVTLTGANVDDYTGTTTVNTNGELIFASNATLAAQVTNDGDLKFNGTSTLTTGLNGSGTSTFTGASTIGTLNGSGTENFNGTASVTTLAQAHTGTANFNQNATITTVGVDTGATPTLASASAGTLNIALDKTLTIANGNFNGTISGSGSLIKTGANRLFLFGANVDNFTGTTTISDGTLQFQNNATLAGQVINNGGYTTFVGTAVLNGGIAGAPTTPNVNNGSGSTYFSGAATISSRSGSGNQYFYADSSIGTISGTAGIIEVGASGVALTLGSGSFSGTLQGVGNFVKDGNGTLTLAGANIDNYTGTTTVNVGGTVTYTNGATLASAGTFTNNGTVNFSDTSTIGVIAGSGTTSIASGELLSIASGTYSGKITGAGSLNKNTTGTLILTGASDYTGDTYIGGILRVNGSIASNTFVYGTLGGSGAVNASVTVESGGILAPGNSPGILTVSGPVTFNAGSSYSAEIGGTVAGNYDQLYVTPGTVNISTTGAGVALNITQWSTFAPTRGDVFDIIKTNSATGITGTFASMTSNFNTFVIFDNNTAAHKNGTLYGTGLGSTQTFANWFTDPNQKAIATALWSGGLTNANAGSGTDLVRFTNTNTSAGKAVVGLLTSSNLSSTLNSYSPEPFLGLNDYALTTVRTVTDATLAQSPLVVKGRWSAGFNYSNASNDFKGGSSSAFNRHLSSGNSVINVEYAFNKSTKLGGFVGFNTGRTSSSTSNIDYDGKVYGLTGFKKLGRKHPIFMKAAIAYASLNFTSSRTDALGTSTSGKNSLNGTVFQVGASTPLYKTSRLTVSPMVGIIRGTSSASAFTETGAGANLSVDKTSLTSTRAMLGVAMDYRATTRLNLGAQLSYEHEFSGSRAVSASLGTSSFTVNNDDVGSTLVLGLNAGYDVNLKTRLNLGAELRQNSDYSNDQRYNAGVNVRF
ncbi:hypothetical protein EBR11_00565 [bacterium]|nr:hypothetical protein [bacterium]